jgi:adenylate cyclase
MPLVREQRKLAAILFVDAVGSSRLMGRDEGGTVARLLEHLNMRLAPAVARRGGRVIRLKGDGGLVEFPSAVDALAAAIDFQQGMVEANRDQPDDKAIVFRIGLHLGDVIIEGDDIYGDDVNVAARLEAEAPAGGIVVSRAVRDAVQGRLKANFHALGELALKNIDRPVRAFRVEWAAEDWPTPSAASGAAASPMNLTPALTLPDKPSIAVLPFQNMSGDPEQEYLADGIVEDIIITLSRSRDFFVIARNSSFSYKGTSPDIRKVGRELGVRYVLEGSVRKAGSRLRITVQLVDAVTGNHHWAERYDCEETDIFSIQDEITEKVVASLEPHVLVAEGGLARHKAPTDLNAWALVARSYTHLAMRTRNDAQTALNLLDQAINCDPEYARAHAYLAQVRVFMAYQGWLADRGQAFEAAAASARRAVELDSNDPMAHYAKGLVTSLGRQHGAALPSLKKAVELNPNFALAHSRLGTILSYLGRSDEGIEHTSRALRISPRDPLRYALLNAHSVALFSAARYAEAIAAAELANQERSGFAQALRMLAAAKALQGDIAGARTALKDLLLAQPGITLTWVDENIDAPDTGRLRMLEGLRLAGLPE